MKPHAKLISEIIRYAGVSAVAFLADFSVLLLLASVLHYLVAATCGFILGGLVAYLLSVRYVFDQRRLADRRAELGLFIVLGLAGLILNLITISLAVESWSLPLALGKVLASGVTFASNFTLRKWLLFSQQKPTTISPN